MSKLYKLFFNIISFIFKKLKIKKTLINNLKINLGLNNLIQNRKSYSYVKDVKCEVRIFSQNGEDGIIDYLINIKINDPNFIEIGVGIMGRQIKISLRKIS